MLPCRDTEGLTVRATFSEAQKLESPKVVSSVKAKYSVADAGGELKRRASLIVMELVGDVGELAQVACTVSTAVVLMARPEKVNSVEVGVCVRVPALNVFVIKESVISPQLIGSTSRLILK
jgi:hypothetical protein